MNNIIDSVLIFMLSFSLYQHCNLFKIRFQLAERRQMDMGNLMIVQNTTLKPTASLTQHPRLYFFFKHAEFGQAVRHLLETEFTITNKSAEDGLKLITLEDCDMLITDTLDVLRAVR